jgi:hypothetical protein
MGASWGEQQTTVMRFLGTNGCCAMALRRIVRRKGRRRRWPTVIGEEAHGRKQRNNISTK